MIQAAQHLVPRGSFSLQEIATAVCLTANCVKTQFHATSAMTDITSTELGTAIAAWHIVEYVLTVQRVLNVSRDTTTR
mgnify:CR=1 FL=1